MYEFTRSSDWASQGGSDNPEDDYPEHLQNLDEQTFFYEKFYQPEFGRFEDLPESLEV